MKILSNCMLTEAMSVQEFVNKDAMCKHKNKMPIILHKDGRIFLNYMNKDKENVCQQDVQCTNTEYVIHITL